MGSAISVLSTALLALVALWRLCRPRSTARQRVASLILLTLTLSALGNLALATEFLDRVSGVPDLTVLVKDLLALFAVNAAGWLVSLMAGYQPTRRRQDRALLALAAVAAAGMVSLFCVIPRHAGGEDFTNAHDHTAAVAAYGLLFQIGAGVTCGISGVRLYRFWRGAPAGAVRRGLLLTWLALAVALLYLTNRAVFVLTHLAGSDTWQGPVFVTASESLLGMSLLLVGLSRPLATLPSAAGWLRDYWALHRLYPLWSDLCRAVPDVALTPPRSRLVEMCTPRSVRLRLYRRVIEIRDAQWALRGHMSSRLREEADRLSRERGLAGPMLAAVVDACVLETAWRARLAGGPAGRSDYVLSEGGTELPVEVRHLLGIENARRTRFVRDFASGVPVSRVPPGDPRSGAPAQSSTGSH